MCVCVCVCVCVLVTSHYGFHKYSIISCSNIKEYLCAFYAHQCAYFLKYAQ